jgi:uncharacterized protein YjbI with pentapeptide repeats
MLTWKELQQERLEVDPLLGGLSLRNRDLSKADLHGASLPKADLCRVKLNDTDLSNSDLVTA